MAKERDPLNTRIWASTPIQTAELWVWHHSGTQVDPLAPTFQLCLQFAGFQIKREGVLYHLTFSFFLQSRQITLKDVIFPPGVIKAHIACGFIGRLLKKSAGTVKKYCFFLQITTPFVVTVNARVLLLVNKATGPKPKLSFSPTLFFELLH